jgi:virulence-associated protein VapD
MTALQSIIKEAKSLKKQYPKRYAKWTDYVKQASAIYASKHKGKSPVGKKRKVGAAKPVSKHKDTKSHNVNIRVVSGIKKKKATKKAVKKSTTLTKVKQVLKKDNLRLKHGYNLTSGSVRIGSVQQSEIDFWIKMFAPRKKSLQLEWYRDLIKNFKLDSFNIFLPKEKGEAQLRALEFILNKKPLQIKN